MELRRYLAEEVAVDCADGLISRREALRRLGLMGIGATAGAALLAACGGPASSAGTSAAPRVASPSRSPVAGTQDVSYPGRSGSLRGSWAPAARARGAVLVVHENRGLTDDIRAIGARLAGDGYAALAVDLLSEEGGTQSFGDPADATAALSQAPPGRFVDDMRSTVDELQRRQPGARLGVIGFCFGGALTWSLLAAHEPRLAAAAPFYGTVPDSPDFSTDTAAVLAVYAGRDSRVNATRPAAESALQKAGLHYEVRVFPDVDHAFFNPSGARYDRTAAEAAYRAVLDWFGRYLG